MITWNDSKNRIIIGFHKNGSNRIDILQEKYPLVVDENYIPFLVTRDNYFELRRNDLNNFLKYKEEESYFRSIKNKVANILIIPGLVISVLYLLKYVGMLEQIFILETFINLPIINTFFWISFLGVIILWHDYSGVISRFTKLPKAEYIPDTEMEDIMFNGFKFSKYGQINPLKYFSYTTLEYLEYGKEKFSPINILSSLFLDDNVSELMKRSGLQLDSTNFKNYKITKDTMPDFPRSSYSLLFLYTLEEALLTNSKEILPIHLFLAILKVFPILKKIVIKQGFSQNLLREVTTYILANQQHVSSLGIFDPQNIYNRTGGIAKNWIYGYTFILNQFSKDLNEEVARETDTFGVGHEKEVENLLAILGRTSKRHALLIGEPGVGKSSLIKGLVQRINRGDVPPILSNTRIVQLDLNGLIALSGRQKNIEFHVQKAMDELAKAGNVILYIDELQELIPTKAKETGHSLADILIPYVTGGQFAIVGTVNYADYKKYFYTNESFRQSFSNIELSELSSKDTLRILETKVKVLEKAYNLFITFPALVSSVELAQRYIHNRMLPDSAVSLLEDTCSWAKTNSVTILNSDHVAKIISLQTNVNVGSITTDEAEKLISLEDRIKRRVIGQDEAVHLISEALRRARADIRDTQRPIGTFLFIGPTGVGKTYLAKIISQEYFNNKEDIVRVDMSEYMDENSVTKLLGSYQDEREGQQQLTLLDRVKSNPYTVVLFDEIEKANPKILDLFLQLFEEGRLTSTKGETVDFTNTIIICTSNIAADQILDSLEKKMMWEETKNMVEMKLKQSIRPELFNRFDGIVVFHPQSIDDLTKISDMLLDELYTRLHEKNIELDWDPTIPMLIASKAYEPGFGARPIRRYIQEKVEGRIATEMINGSIKAGDDVKIKEAWII